MTTVASQRLIDAAAALAPADRALLNLLVTRGLDNDSLARLSRMTAAAIVARRERMVHRLSDELGLPADQVRGRLVKLAVAPPQPRSDAEPVTPLNGNGARPPAGGPLDAAPGQPGPSPQRSKRKLLVSAAVAGLGIAATVAVLLTSATAKHARGAPATVSTPFASTASTLTQAPPALITTPAHPAAPAHHRANHRRAAHRQSRGVHHSAAASRAQPLTILPGATAKATGSVALAGTASHPRLVLKITGRIAATDGHYEAWLYNSILDSAPLVRLRMGVASFNVALPRGYRRYHWIDISFQPPGLVNDSGQSVMRASVPR